MKPEEQLLLALTDVGDDLIEEAGHLSFPRPRWLRGLPMVACLVLLLGGALALQGLQPLEQTSDTQNTVQDSQDTTAELPPDGEADVDASDHLAQLLAPQAAYVLPMSDDILGPAVAVDNNGNVIASTDYGIITPLQDRSTGEFLAMMVENREVDQTVPAADNLISLYSLEGKKLTDVSAAAMDCLGELVVVYRGTGIDLYRRSDGVLLAAGLADVRIAGPDLLYAQAEAGGPVTVYNSAGQVVAEVKDVYESVPSLGWDGQAYLCAMDDAGLVGLLNSSGQWVVEPGYRYFYSASCGYALGRSETGYAAISLADGTVAFESEVYISSAFEQGLTLDPTGDYLSTVMITAEELEESTAQFVSWDGTVLAEGPQVQGIDDEGDGVAELISVHRDNYIDLLRPDGTLIRRVDVSVGSMNLISSETAVVMNNVQADDGSWIMDFFLLDVESGAEFRDFDRPYSFASGLWYTVDNYSQYSFSTHRFEASYRDADGNYHWDLLDESGKVLLEDIQSYQGGDVYAVLDDGQYALQRLDGTILYRHGADEPATGEICVLPPNTQE